MKLNVDTADVGEPLLARTVPEALGIDNKELLVAAIDRRGHSIDIGAIVPDDTYPERSVARLMHQGLFHSDGENVADHREMEDDTWLNLGEDTAAEIDQALANLEQESVDNRISEHGKAQLRRMLNRYCDVFRLRLGNDPLQMANQ